MSEHKERSLQDIGRDSLKSLREMVAALECEYERLEELKEIKANFEPGESGQTWEMACPDEAEELKELEAEAGECSSREDAEQRIQEDALSVEVRSAWTALGATMEAEEFCILLTTGGPAVRIIGELDEYKEPHRAWLQVQDWGTPWTDYFEDDMSDTCLTYARCVYFG